jgi:hypothetical protein
MKAPLSKLPLPTQICVPHEETLDEEGTGQRSQADTIVEDDFHPVCSRCEGKDLQTVCLHRVAGR